jgi:aminoglycoside phosphotransferase (APT) family kinase protein
MELIAEGRTAEVFDAGPGRVLKLLRSGFHEHLLDLEADRTSAAHAAGVPAPAVFDRVAVDGRVGVELERIAGRVMIDEIRRAPWNAGRWGQRLADLHSDVTARTSADLPDVKDRLTEAIDATDLPGSQRAAAKDVLLGLPDADHVLHGDFHPLNVMVDDERLVVIDWVDAARGSPAADVARTAWLMSPVAIPDDVPMRRVIQFVGGFVRRAYLRGMPLIAEPDEVAAWRLPVVAARLAEGIPYEDDALRAEVARLVR